MLLFCSHCSICLLRTYTLTRMPSSTHLQKCLRSFSRAYLYHGRVQMLTAVLSLISRSVKNGSSWVLRSSSRSWRPRKKPNKKQRKKQRRRQVVGPPVFRFNNKTKYAVLYRIQRWCVQRKERKPNRVTRSLSKTSPLFGSRQRWVALFRSRYVGGGGVWTLSALLLTPLLGSRKSMKKLAYSPKRLENHIKAMPGKLSAAPLPPSWLVFLHWN